jgi:hypothetical protein
LILKEYPHPSLTREDKELFFNTALLGKSFIPSLIHARALRQLIDCVNSDRYDEQQGFYGISRPELLAMSAILDDGDLLANASCAYDVLLAKLRKIYASAQSWIRYVEKCLLERKDLDNSDINASGSTLINFSADATDCPTFGDDCNGLSLTDENQNSSSMDFPLFKRPLISFRLSTADMNTCKDFLEHKDSHGLFYPPQPLSSLQYAFLMESEISLQDSTVKINKKFFSYKSGAGKGIFNGPRIMACDTELLYMGVIYHGIYDEDKMEEILVNACSVNLDGKDHNFMDRILEIKKDEIYILGYQHLFTSLFNEHPTPSQNIIRIISNPSIGLLRIGKEVLPFEELTLNYGDVLCKGDIHTIPESQSKRTRTAPIRYSASVAAPSKGKKRGRNNSTPLTQDDTACTEEIDDGGSDQESSIDDPVTYFRNNSEYIIDYMKSLGQDKLQEMLGVKIVQEGIVDSISTELINDLAPPIVVPSIVTFESTKIDAASTLTEVQDLGYTFLEMSWAPQTLSSHLRSGVSDEKHQLIRLASGLNKTNSNDWIAAYHEEVFGNDESDDKMHVKQIDDLDSNSKLSELAEGLSAAIQLFFAKVNWNFHASTGTHILIITYCNYYIILI